MIKKATRPVYPVRKLEKPVRAVKPTAKVIANHEEAQQQAFHAKVRKIAHGKSDSENGLYDDQIDKIMDRFKDYKGSIMRDQIKSLLPNIKPQSRVAFIINTQDHTKPGQHWQAVYIDGRDGPESSNSIEFFDSFGSPMPPDIREDIKLILKIMKPHTILKLKENQVVHQKDSSSNCGYFAMNFLIDRFRNRSFSEATGYDDRVKLNHAKHDEAEIEKMKQMKPFSYILAE